MVHRRRIMRCRRKGNEDIGRAGKVGGRQRPTPRCGDE